MRFRVAGCNPHRRASWRVVRNGSFISEGVRGQLLLTLQEHGEQLVVFVIGELTGGMAFGEAITDGLELLDRCSSGDGPLAG